MLFSIGLLLVIVFLAYKASPASAKKTPTCTAPGRLACWRQWRLFGVDYFTSYFYATGEMMSALHPYGLQNMLISPWSSSHGELRLRRAVHVLAGHLQRRRRFIHGFDALSVADAEPDRGRDVDSRLCVDDRRLGVVGRRPIAFRLGRYGTHWFWHFAIGAALAAVTWYLTIRGRGESSRVVFTLLGIFVMMTITMAIGLIMANFSGVPAVASH